MKVSLILITAFFIFSFARSQELFPASSKTLSNGLKVIVCEKPGNQFAEIQLWYRTGSKDETDGARGMAHMFEHMMFRGTKKYPDDSFSENIRRAGGHCNAYTTSDRTVYHQNVPLSSVELVFDMEADRMSNLIVTREILDTEREVVGEELRLWMNNWLRRMYLDRYPLLYPEGHPYKVETIGFLKDIQNFTSQQCMEFYNNFYSPDNAFLVVAGNVKSNEIFDLAEKYFAKISKQLTIRLVKNPPDVFSNKLMKNELYINYPVQIYSYAFAAPRSDSEDFFALQMLTDILFLNKNSILNNRLTKKEHLAYGITTMGDIWNIYDNIMVLDVIMNASPGNVKVKKIIKEEILKITGQGISLEIIDRFVRSKESSDILMIYESAAVADRLGIAEFYLKDFKKAFTLMEEYRKISPEQIKKVAIKYFCEECLQVINIKPE